MELEGVVHVEVEIDRANRRQCGSEGMADKKDGFWSVVLPEILKRPVDGKPEDRRGVGAPETAVDKDRLLRVAGVG